MIATHRLAVLALGAMVFVLFSFSACANKAVPLGVVLDTPQHHVLSGMRLFELGKCKDAVREFELATHAAPAFSKAYVGSGLASACVGDWQKGLKDIEMARKLARTDEEKESAGIGLIRLYLIKTGPSETKWLDMAKAAYRDAMALSPDSAGAHYYMGRAYEKARYLDRAKDLFKRVLEINKSHVDEATEALNRIKYQ